MQRLRNWFFWVLMILIGVECSGREMQVITSLYPIHIATLNVVAGVPDLKVQCLAPPDGGCLHDFSLSADDMVRLSKADVVICNGMGADSFLDEPMSRLGNVKVINASEGIEPIMGEGEVNPHVWLGIALHMRQVRRIAEGLAAADPDHADRYAENATAYMQRLDSLRKRFLKDVNEIQQKNIVTFHDAFPYFAAEFGFKIAAVVQRHPGSEPGAQELKKTIQTVRAKRIRAIFAEPQFPSGSAKVIAGETGAKVLMLDPVVTGPIRADAYIQAMERNLAILREGLLPEKSVLPSAP